MPTLIACSHGTNSPAGRTAIRDQIRRAELVLPGVRVAEAFVDVQQPGIDTVVDREAPRAGAVVVPLLLSTGFHTNVDIARAVAAHPGVAVAAPALGPHELLVDVLEARLRAAGVRAGDAVVLAAAGSSDPAAAVDVADMARRLAARVGLRVDVGFAAGKGTRIARAVSAVRADGASRVIAASYVLAPGYFADVVAASGADVVTAPLAPDDRIAELIAARFLAAASSLPVPA